MAAKPSSKLFSDFEQVFRHFDKDGDGKISSAELRLCLKAIDHDLSQEDVEALVEFDGDGLLGFEELAKLVQVEGDDQEEEERSRELRVAFGMFEIEGEGCITAKSLKRMLSRLGTSRDMEECRAMICRFDLNGDGVLSFDEFKVMMQ